MTESHAPLVFPPKNVLARNSCKLTLIYERRKDQMSYFLVESVQFKCLNIKFLLLHYLGVTHIFLFVLNTIYTMAIDLVYSILVHSSCYGTILQFLNDISCKIIFLVA